MSTPATVFAGLLIAAVWCWYLFHAPVDAWWYLRAYDERIPLRTE
jgi:hypothetical protein